MDRLGTVVSDFESGDCFLLRGEGPDGERGLYSFLASTVSVDGDFVLLDAGLPFGFMSWSLRSFSPALELTPALISDLVSDMTGETGDVGYMLVGLAQAPPPLASVCFAE